MNSLQMNREQIGPLDCLVIPNSPKTCVVLFHGYGADASDLAPLASALGGDFTWIFPNGVNSLSPHFPTGRAWFEIDTESLERHLAAGTHRDLSIFRPTDIESTYKKGRAFLDELESQYDQIILGGFSQGAMFSTELTLRAPQKPKALIILSGSLLSRKHWAQWAPSCKGLPFFQSHGDQDPLLSFHQAENLFEMLTETEWVGEFHSFSGQHEIPPGIIVALRSFLKSFS